MFFSLLFNDFVGHSSKKARKKLLLNMLTGHAVVAAGTDDLLMMNSLTSAEWRFSSVTP